MAVEARVPATFKIDKNTKRRVDLMASALGVDKSRVIEQAVEALAERSKAQMNQFLDEARQSFAGDARTAADRYVKLGFCISFAGPVTYPTAHNLWAAAQKVLLDKLTVETDAPYLPPQSHRGKRNEPSYVTETAARIATLRQIDVREVEAASDANAAALYGLPVGARAGAR